MPFSWALHTYFAINDIAQTRIRGLGDEEDFTFQGEVDQVLTQVPECQNIVCDGMLGSIEISGQHCPSAIIWNPGREKAAAMNDLGQEHYSGFVCVERGAAKSDTWSIPAGETRHARLELSRKR
jgi:glucose-6-phosphate 1-epimerase